MYDILAFTSKSILIKSGSVLRASSIGKKDLFKNYSYSIETVQR